MARTRKRTSSPTRRRRKEVSAGIGHTTGVPKNAGIRPNLAKMRKAGELPPLAPRKKAKRRKKRSPALATLMAVGAERRRAARDARRLR